MGRLFDKSKYYYYLTTEKWKSIADLIRRKFKWICQKCGRRGWQVHHLNYAYLFQEERNLDCLTLLCEECHRLEHGIGTPTTAQLLAKLKAL